MVLNGSPSRYRCFKLFKTSALPIRMKPIRCSSLQFVAVRVGSNQFFALRIALRIASLRNGLVRIGRVWRWARNQKVLTRTDSTQHSTDTVPVACRAQSFLFTVWRYDAVQFTSRTTKDSYGLQRCATMEWDKIQIRVAESIFKHYLLTIPIRHIRLFIWWDDEPLFSSVMYVFS